MKQLHQKLPHQSCVPPKEVAQVDPPESNYRQKSHIKAQLGYIAVVSQFIHCKRYCRRPPQCVQESLKDAQCKGLHSPHS